MKYTLSALSCLVVLFAACAPEAPKVAMPQKKMTITDASVQATGHWKAVTKPKEPVLQAVPQINAVDLRCYREDMICIETLASLYQKSDGNPEDLPSLFPHRFVYKIVKWDESGLLAKSETSVANVELKVSLSDKTASRAMVDSRGAATQTLAWSWVLE
ncbi:MAG TPA: hypothetical protein VLH56_09320 [Dissulfurispiraceae bacterium]|nr:hypothetical protein [Dissulfurispiraceae bacterium]